MLFQEIRFAYRLLVRNPGFTAIAVLSLAVGIGANSAIFSLADAILLRPVPIVQHSQVVTISADSPGEQVGLGALSYPDYRDMREKARSFSGMTAFALTRLSAAKTASEMPRMRGALMVSENFFPGK